MTHANTDDSVPTAGTRVLLIEDSDTIRLVMAGALQGEGLEVIEAVDGEEALALAAEHVGTIDLVLCDVTLPGAQGPEVMAEMRTIDASPAVVFTSGADMDLAGQNIPGAKFLAKPFKLDELVDVIQSALADRPRP